MSPQGYWNGLRAHGGTLTTRRGERPRLAIARAGRGTNIRLHSPHAIMGAGIGNF
jgi:hypothetical protein